MEIYKNLPGLAIPFIFYAVRAFVIHPSTLFSVLLAFSIIFCIFGNGFSFGKKRRQAKNGYKCIRYVLSSELGVVSSLVCHCRWRWCCSFSTVQQPPPPEQQFSVRGPQETFPAAPHHQPYTHQANTKNNRSPQPEPNALTLMQSRRFYFLSDSQIFFAHIF